MIYRRFGKTGLSMPVLSFGCMRSMYDWKDAPAETIPIESTTKLETIVRTALGHGINHIETAHGYGSSERQLGIILATIPRKAFILQTKVVPSADSDEFHAKVLSSMERLQVDRLDLLAIHGINDHRSLWQTCRKGGCLDVARKLRDRGMVDFIGFSGHGPCDVIIDALKYDGTDGFDYFNVHWYYILDANRRAIEVAADRDIGTFIISPSDKGGYLHTPTEKLKKLCLPLSPMLFNDIYCLKQEGVTTISVGASQPEHFDEHLKALPFLESGNFELVSTIGKRLENAMQESSGNGRPDNLWNHLPAWEQAPGNINIRMISWLLNLYLGWDMHHYARDRYEKLGTGSGWVPGNNGVAAQELDFSGIVLPDRFSSTDVKDLVHQAHGLLLKKSSA